MAMLKRIGPGSAFKVGFVTYGLLGFIAGLLCSVVALAAPAAHPAYLPFGHYAGLFAFILCPLLYGLVGGIAAVIGALLYNIASRWVGGVHIELE